MDLVDNSVVLLSVYSVPVPQEKCVDVSGIQGASPNNRISVDCFMFERAWVRRCEIGDFMRCCHMARKGVGQEFCTAGGWVRYVFPAEK